MATEKKKVKVVEILPLQRSYPGKNGTLFVHHIAFESDNQRWEYHTTNENVEKFKVGETMEAEFNVEIVQRGDKTYTNYKVKPFEEKASTGGGGRRNADFDHGAVAMQSCIASACNLIAEKGGSFDHERHKQAMQYAKEFFNLVADASTLPNKPYKKFTDIK